MDESLLPMTSQAAIYNVRLITVYLKLIREKYPHVSITRILDYAGLEPYEIEDEGHWITQEQIDRFYEKVVQLTGNENIAREAGRLAAQPGSIGIMRQYTLGMLSPFQAFASISKASMNFTRSSDYRSKALSRTKVEITVTPKPDIQEKPCQCENRIGFFEAIVSGFNLGMPKIEHPECIFKGGKCCRYTVTWRRTVAHLLGRIRSLILVVSAVVILPGLLVHPIPTVHFVLPAALIIGTLVSLATETARRKELARGMEEVRGTTERLTEQIDTNYRNIQLTNEIGQALASKKSVDDVLHSVVQIMEKRLDFDRGALLLANANKTHLEIRGAYGYTSRHLGDLSSTAFSLNNPSSQSPFVISFHNKKPFLVNDVKEIEGKLTPKSRKFINGLGTKSFLCCPIVVEGETLGILGVDNLTSKRPLVRNDLSLLQGIAPVIGVALQNAALIEEQQIAFEKTLKILADSIDARDFLTAGHSEVVMEYAAGIALELGHNEEYVQMIRIAALLHDYGKIGIPDSILKKDGRLTNEERAIINTHPSKTREILSQVPFQGLQKQIPQITGAHHERWDGSGYPDALKGEEIPLGARILAVADFFEAITSKRHYRDPMPLDVALRLLYEEAGQHFDPEIVNAFVRYLQTRKFCLISPQTATENKVATHRKSARVDYRTHVSGQYGQRIISGTSLDIGLYGAFISSADTIDANVSITLTFQPPGSNQLTQIQGRVVWTNSPQMPVSSNHPKGFGVEFIDLSIPLKQLLQRFLSVHAPGEKRPGKIIYPSKFAQKPPGT